MVHAASEAFVSELCDAVESGMGAGTDVWRRPVSHSRSSNRTCRFPASGFPTGFIADSRSGVTQRTPEPEDTQLTEDPLHRKLTGALRLHLVPLSQKMPYPFLHMLIEHFVRLAGTPQSEVRFPSSEFLIQPVAYLFPWSSIAGF